MSASNISAISERNDSEPHAAERAGAGKIPLDDPADIAGLQAVIDGQRKWHVHHGDCVEHMANMPPHSVDFSVFSPPFPSVFSYSSLPNDLGNNNDLPREAKLHFSFFFKQLVRVIKPGRVVMVHVMQIPGLALNGEKGTFDFRGLLIRLAQRAGFIYQYDWIVRRNPQAEAIRTHSHRLLFVSLERDRATSCGSFGDYLIKFIAPGDNAVPINSPGISRQDWIEWAECCWQGIRMSDTLNIREAKGEHDTRHICALQLQVIERLVKLYSNPDEIVFSPFGGISSEAYMAVKLGRRGYLCELKDEYYVAAKKNLAKAERLERESNRTLFDGMEDGGSDGDKNGDGSEQTESIGVAGGGGARYGMGGSEMPMEQRGPEQEALAYEDRQPAAEGVESEGAA